MEQDVSSKVEQLLMHDDRVGVGSGSAPEMLAPDASTSYAELRKLNIFDGLPNDALSAAIAAGAIRRVVLRRDVVVADSALLAAHGERVCFVARGQVAVAVFDPGALTRRREDQQRYDRMTEAERAELSLMPPEPLTRVAKKNLAAFVVGDLFNTAALPPVPAVDSFRDTAQLATAFFTVAPTVLVELSPACIRELAVQFRFFEARLRRAIEVGRERLRNIVGVKQEIFDFFVRQGISVAGDMVRVRQLDLCIDCKLCEQACEDRYGARRLTLGGYQLGMLDFIYTCRTCSDQRCIDPCEYDSISFNPDTREVQINDSSCTGCTMCAQVCPYGAIEMVDVEDPSNTTYRDSFKLRLERDGALAFGPGRPRRARPRRIANKCDHCASYGDQACVTACPTGSLIEVSPLDVFRERSVSATAAARAGYDQDVAPEGAELLPTDPFVKGLGVRNAGVAKVKRAKLNPALLWGVGLAAWFLALAEILLRIWAPQSSLQYWLYLREGREPAQAALAVGFRAGNELAVYCGYVGTGLLAISVIYPMMRRIKAFRLIAANQVWFDLHMMAGTVGPLFIVLHSALKLDNWVSIPFWSMMIVVISGVVGRYLYTQVPDMLNGRELEELDHQRAFARLRAQHPDALAIVDDELRSHRERAAHVAEHRGLVYAMWWIIAEDLRRPARWLSRRLALRKSVAPSAVTRELAARTSRMLVIARRFVMLPRARQLLRSWKWAHVPFSVILLVFSAAHIYYAFKYSM